MMNKTTMISATVCGLLLSTSVALAATSPSTETAPATQLNGWYLGGGLTQSFTDESNVDIDYNGFGLDLFGGYKWQVASAWVAGIEAESLYLAQVGSTDFGAMAINAIAEYQFNDKISMSTKVGAVVEDLSYQDFDYSSETTALLGTALQYHWTPRWSAYVNYEHIFGDSWEKADEKVFEDVNSSPAMAVDLVGLGVQYTW